MPEKKPSHFVSFNSKKNTYCIYPMGPLRVNAKTALVPDSDNEYGLVQVKFKGSEKSCESWAKYTYNDINSSFCPTDSEMPVRNDDQHIVKNNNKSNLEIREELEKIKNAKLLQEQDPTTKLSVKTALTPFRNSLNRSSTPKHHLSCDDDPEDTDNESVKKKKKTNKAYKSSEKLAEKIAALGSDSSFSTDLENNDKKKNSVSKKLFNDVASEDLIEIENQDSNRDNQNHLDYDLIANETQPEVQSSTEFDSSQDDSKKLLLGLTKEVFEIRNHMTTQAEQFAELFRLKTV